MPTQVTLSSTFADTAHFPAITVYQPYAGLIHIAGLYGFGKDIEVRPKSINQRGPVVICAGKRVDAEAYMRARTILVGGGLMKLPDFEHICGSALCGHAVALFNLADCRRLAPEDHGRTFVSPTMADLANQWSWIADSITALNPFPVRGAQGFFRVSKTTVIDAMARGTTLAKRIEIRERIKRHSRQSPCKCGRTFPKHLVDFMNNDHRVKHECACGKAYVVTNMKFVECKKEVTSGA